MHAAVMSYAGVADMVDMVIMAAAVADYMPRERVDGKMQKSDAPLSLDLVRTPDILADLGKARVAGGRPLLVGFAAQSGDPVDAARRKLHAKQVDMVVANDISRADAGFDTDTNAVTLITADRDEAVALAPKAQIAGVILDRAEQILERVAAR
jgi:phosphopantothenoylcysteine decarboxylase/phosphopantothenate--cysteine ligase